MSTETPHRRRIFISLRLKVLIAFTILFTVIFIGTYYWFYVFSTARAEKRIREDLMSTMVAAAAEIDGDEIVALYREGVPREDGFTDDPRYWDDIAWLDTVHKIEPRAWLGTYVRDGNNFYFVTDLWALYDPDSAAKFQEWCDPNPEVCGADAPFEEWTSIQALTREEPILHPTIISDQWGTWMSGFAPLKNKDGETVAGMFVDFEADYVREVQQGIRDNIALAFAITYGFFFIFIFVIATWGSRPILKFTRAAEAVGEGDYDQDFSKLTSTQFHDEISTLAGVMSIMIDKVSQREENLKQRVAELRIEIDEAKKEKDLKKIVESDSFRALREKAREMRQRRSTPKDTSAVETSENAD